MVILYVQSNVGEGKQFRQEIGRYETRAEAIKMMDMHPLTKRHSQPFSRQWLDSDDPTITWIDVGSWSQFFLIKEEK